MAKSIDMTGGSPARNILSFAWPILLGYLFHQVYSLADKVIVGQFVGDAAFAAIGTTAAGSNIFMSFSQGMCAGSGVVAAQFFGAKDDKGSAKPQRKDQIIYAICRLCRLHQQTCFIDGIRLGIKLI